MTKYLKKISTAKCNHCGIDFEQSKSQAQRSGNKYCSRECVSRATAGLQYPELPQWAETLLVECRKRAKRKGIDFDLTARDMQILIKESGMRCQLSHIAFDTDESDKERGINRPYAPSIDRIDSSLGYINGNVRLVLVCVNIAMNKWGFDVLLKISLGITQASEQKDGYKPKNTRKSGLMPGVYIISKGKLGARYGVRYKNKWIGYYDSELDAHMYYRRHKMQMECCDKASIAS